MPKHSRSHAAESVLDLKGFASLIAALQGRAYTVIGPVLRDGAIDWHPIDGPEDFPCGWTADQAPGRYRLAPRKDDAYFGYATGPASLKRFIHQADVRLFAVESNGNPFHILENRDEAPRRAFIGVRACDVASLKILDRVLLDDRYPDALYRKNREGIFIVAVNCTEPSQSCFCTSTNAGPEIESGYDILLTEVLEEGSHRFLAKIGTERGKQVMAEVEHSDASEAMRNAAAAVVAQARAKVVRKLDMTAARQALYDRFEDPEWERVAAKCLGCGNCTQVCPTCFCVTVEDTSDIDGHRAERWRKWDSCFTLSHSYIHGGSVRQSPKARYRQWLTHKLAAWQEQFGMAGCSGCGRCITWCPAGIDMTEIVANIQNRSAEKRPGS